MQRKERDSLSRHVSSINGLERRTANHCQWLGTPAQICQKVHVVSHSELHTRRPNLWLKYVGLLDFDPQQAAESKMSLSNTVVLTQVMHASLRDSDFAEGKQLIYGLASVGELDTTSDDERSDSGDETGSEAGSSSSKGDSAVGQEDARFRMIIVPVRDDLLLAIELIEKALAAEELACPRGQWQPQPDNWLDGWTRHTECPKVSNQCRLTKYAICCFAKPEDWQEYRPITWTQNGQVVAPSPTGATLPLELQPAIPERLLPLSLPFVVLAATTALWFLDSEETYSPSFRETIKLMDYLLKLYESKTPSAWRTRRPDGLLSFSAPPSPGHMSTAERIWAGDSPPSSFSTSPPRGIAHLPASRAACHGKGMMFEITEAQLRTMADSLAHDIWKRLTADGSIAETLRKEGYEALGETIANKHKELVKSVDALKAARREEDLRVGS